MGISCIESPYKIEFTGTMIEKIASSKRILIQLSDGLKQYSTKIVECIRKINDQADIIVDASPVYGACDLHLEVFKAIKPDLVIHVGHNEYPTQLGGIPGLEELVHQTIFIPAYSAIKLGEELLDALYSRLIELGSMRVGLITTIQHKPLLEEVDSYLARRGIKVVIPKPAYPTMSRGQILGCEYSAIRTVERIVDSYVLLSGGRFHYIGSLLSTNKKVVKIDPYEKKIVLDDTLRDRILKKRYYKIYQSLDSKTYGIIIGAKTGQFREWLTRYLIKKIVSKKKEFYKFIVASLNKDILLNIDRKEIDAYIVTSCPRLPIDDLDHFHKPVLTPGEALMVLNEELDKYRFPW